MLTLYPVVDPDLQIRGGQVIQEEGGGLKNFFFRPSGLSLVQK